MVRFNPRAGLDPEIDQWSASPFWGSKRFGDRVAFMQTSVASEIVIFEYDCKGASRREDMLTDSFRQECDARGGGKQPVRTARPAEQWSAPVAPTPTTLGQIKADDAAITSRREPTKHPEDHARDEDSRRVNRS